MIDKKKYKESTLITHAGQNSSEHFGFVNTPVYRGSTVLSENSKQFRERTSRYFYGSKSNPNTESLSEGIKLLENADGCKITNSGRTAILLSLLSVLSTGDQLILSDNVYEPTKQIAEKFLSKMGIETVYFNPKDLGKLEDKITKRTKAVFFESPGSLTFEILDINKLVSICSKSNLFTIIDNTWATPLYFKPFKYGIDISVHAGTKYMVGHSDVFMGAVTYNKRAQAYIEETFDILRISSNADDAYMANRGLRTINVRMKKQFENALRVCEFLSDHKKIIEILYPPFYRSRDHDLWKKYFLGGGGSLMSIIIDNENNDIETLDKFIDGLSLFGIGASWGGYESLVMPIFPKRETTKEWLKYPNSMARIHIGLEDADDLIQDLGSSLDSL